MMAVGRRAASASRRTLTGVPCKTSIMWSFDAAKGDFLWAKSTVYQNLVKDIDAKGQVTANPDMFMTDLKKTYRQCPTHAGGRDWPFSAYSPQTNVMYVQLQNLCADYKVRVNNIPSKPSDQYNTIGPQVLSDGSTNIGRLDAISVETAYLVELGDPASNYSPAGHGRRHPVQRIDDRYLRAFDQSDGKVLWQTRLGSQVFGATVTYQSRGAAIYRGRLAAASTRADRDLSRPGPARGGNMVYVFALPQ
jgi:alcohol dehydrogenase (cytochrome c)